MRARLQRRTSSQSNASRYRRDSPPADASVSPTNVNVASRFAHNFAQIPVVARKEASGGDETARAETVDEAPEIGVKIAEPSGDNFHVKVQIVSGSKFAADYETDEKPPLGKLKGGHVVINLGSDGVLGFTNTKEGARVFSRRKSKSSKFEHYSQGEWAAKTKGKQVVTFDVTITAEQRKLLKQAFEGDPSVDYSVFGYRCASYALRALEEAGIIKASPLAIKYFYAVTPTSLIRFLESKGYEPVVQEGTKERVWNRRFKAARRADRQRRD